MSYLVHRNDRRRLRTRIRNGWQILRLYGEAASFSGAVEGNVVLTREVEQVVTESSTEEKKDEKLDCKLYPDQFDQ